MRALGRLRGWPPAPNQCTTTPQRHLRRTAYAVHFQFEAIYSRPGDLEAKQLRRARQRVPNPRAGRQKILETDPALLRRTPFLMRDQLFRIQKITAFGGGVKMQFSKSKKGGRGAS